MIDKNQLRSLITETLIYYGHHSDAAVELLMMTAAVESQLGTYIYQIRGPARGIFQMEPATETDIWRNYIEYHDDVLEKIAHYEAGMPDELSWNIKYAILMCRTHYLRVSERLPKANDIEGLARYWKQYYNTPKGKGSVEKAIESYEKYCL